MRASALTTVAHRSFFAASVATPRMVCSSASASSDSSQLNIVHCSRCSKERHPAFCFALAASKCRFAAACPILCSPLSVSWQKNCSRAFANVRNSHAFVAKTGLRP